MHVSKRSSDRRACADVPKLKISISGKAPAHASSVVMDGGGAHSSPTPELKADVMLSTQSCPSMETQLPASLCWYKSETFCAMSDWTTYAQKGDASRPCDPESVELSSEVIKPPSGQVKS